MVDTFFDPLHLLVSLRKFGVDDQIDEFFVVGMRDHLFLSSWAENEFLAIIKISDEILVDHRLESLSILDLALGSHVLQKVVGEGVNVVQVCQRMRLTKKLLPEEWREMPIERLLRSNSKAKDMTQEFEHGLISWRIRARIRKIAVSVFSEIVPVVRSLEQKRQNIRLQLILNDIGQKFSEWSSPVVTIFTLKVEFECLVLDRVHSEAIRQGRFLLALGEHLTKECKLSRVVNFASVSVGRGLQARDIHPLSFGSWELLDFFVNFLVFHACE